MPTNKNELRKELETGIRNVNNELNKYNEMFKNGVIDNNAYSIAHGLLKDRREELLRIMEICVQRNRF